MELISIPAYATEQQWRQSVRRSKKWNVINVVNFQKWCSLFSIAGHFVALFQKLLTR
jgi:hypothetical protein